MTFSKICIQSIPKKIKKLNGDHLGKKTIGSLYKLWNDMKLSNTHPILCMFAFKYTQIII